MLSERDIKLMLGHTARSAFPARNRCMFLLMLYSGMRVGEMAALNKGNLVSSDGRMREQIQLKPHQTKGSKARTVLLNAQAHTELDLYLRGDQRSAAYRVNRRIGADQLKTAGQPEKDRLTPLH